MGSLEQTLLRGLLEACAEGEPIISVYWAAGQENVDEQVAEKILGAVSEITGYTAVKIDKSSEHVNRYYLSGALVKKGSWLDAKDPANRKREILQRLNQIEQEDRGIGFTSIEYVIDARKSNDLPPMTPEELVKAKAECDKNRDKEESLFGEENDLVAEYFLLDGARPVLVDSNYGWSEPFPGTRRIMLTKWRQKI